ncbi:hypothetical protein [Pseudoduganella buxea]|nr:hypothetical protein [Pseudoduganella buxea]
MKSIISLASKDSISGTGRAPRSHWRTGVLALVAVAVAGCADTGTSGLSGTGTSGSGYAGASTMTDGATTSSSMGSSGSTGSTSGTGAMGSHGTGTTQGAQLTWNGVVQSIEPMSRQSAGIGVTGSTGAAAAGGTVPSTAGSGNQVYRVTLRTDDGSSQSMVVETPPDYKVGDRVTYSNGAIRRQ